jgi:hypothetical protein
MDEDGPKTHPILEIYLAYRTKKRITLESGIIIIIYVVSLIVGLHILFSRY